MAGNGQEGRFAVLRYAGAFIAFMVGSGFATGQEVMQYYVAFGYGGFAAALLAFALSCAVFAAAFFCAALAAAKYKQTER